MTEILDWRRVGRPRTAARVLGSSLRQGAVVAFPTESSYLVVASALAEGAVARAQELVGSQPLQILLAAPSAARDWLPRLGAAGQRVTRRLWPGPLTLVSREGVSDGLTSRLPSRLQALLAPEDTLHLRHPGHEAILAVLARFATPLIGASLTTGEGEAFNPRDVVAVTGNRLDLVVDGQARFDRPPTFVEVRSGEWGIRREGALSAGQVRDELACSIVFVCTGNTCRSPLAEGLCKVRLAERLGCRTEELEERGYRVTSAGLAAAPGYPAAVEAIEVAQTYGADLTRHESRQLTLEEATRADHLFVMTRGHAEALMPQLPPGVQRPRLLSPTGEDVDDPIGGSREVYEACARQLDDYLRALVEEVFGRQGGDDDG